MHYHNKSSKKTDTENKKGQISASNTMFPAQMPKTLSQIQKLQLKMYADVVKTLVYFQKVVTRKNVVYQATLTQENGKIDTYVGLTSTPFWKRYSGHKTSFKHQKYAHETTLSTFIWDLKLKNISFSLKWKIIDRGKPYNPVTGDCQLCLKEKYIIIFKPEISTLNSRNELASTCRHRTSSLLMRIK